MPCYTPCCMATTAANQRVSSFLFLPLRRGTGVAEPQQLPLHTHFCFICSVRLATCDAKKYPEERRHLLFWWGRRPTTTHSLSPSHSLFSSLSLSLSLSLLFLSRPPLLSPTCWTTVGHLAGVLGKYQVHVVKQNTYDDQYQHVCTTPKVCTIRIISLGNNSKGIRTQVYS